MSSDSSVPVSSAVDFPVEEEEIPDFEEDPYDDEPVEFEEDPEPEENQDQDQDQDQPATDDDETSMHDSESPASPPRPNTITSQPSNESPTTPLQASTSSPSSAPPPPQLTSPPSNSRSSLRSALLRLQSDLKSMESDPPESCTAAPIDSSNLFVWRGCIFGIPDSEWEGSILSLQLAFPSDYPQRPPKVRFTSPIFHPNVFPSDGSLCLDIIQDKWSPVYSVSTILTSIQSLLTDPNIASPANPEAAQLFANNPKEYRKRVRQTIAKSC